MRWFGVIDLLRRVSRRSSCHMADHEKRKALRVARSFALVAQRQDGETVPMTVVDCACKGLRVECARRLQRGEMVKLALKDFDERWERTNFDEVPRATVVWERRHRELLTYQIGLAFLLDTPAQRRGIANFLLNECKVGITNPREQRHAPRISTAMNVQVRRENGFLFNATVKNIAVGGALLATIRPLAENERIEISVFLNEDSSTPLQCAGNVRRCQPGTRNSYEVGVAFTTLSKRNLGRLAGAISRLLRGPTRSWTRVC